MDPIEVRPEGGDRYRIAIRGHEVVVDQPLDDGGTDAGPTPTELFVAGLASFVAYYGGRYLRRHRISERGFEVDGAFAFALDRPARVGEIELVVRLPEGFPPERSSAFLAVLEHCTVHNSIVSTPRIQIALETEYRAALSPR
jgi:uncharacterized OsmC-like protein